MMCAYYSSERLVPYDEEGEAVSEKIDFKKLKSSLIRAKVEVGEATNYSASTAVSILDKLLEGGYISAKQYIDHLPDGFVLDKDMLAEEGEENDKETGNRSDS